MLGALAAVGAVGLMHGFLDESDVVLGAALFLALTAASYPGALLVGSPARGVAAAELVVGATVFAAAVIGSQGLVGWLAAGYLIHAAWDALHHGQHLGRRIAPWFPPACALFDIAAAVGLILLF